MSSRGLSIFGEVHWKRKGDRVWSSYQGPYLIDLDIFLDDGTAYKENGFVLGKNFKGECLLMIPTKEKGWVLVTETNNNLFFTPTLRSKETLEFIEAFWEVYGKEHYSYQNTVFIKQKIKIEVFCNKVTNGKVHGTFFQGAWNHRLNHQGCKFCISDRSSQKVSKAAENFLKRSKEIHGERYDYSKVEYIDRTKRVIIICKIHGPFPQAPQVHLQRSGCPECSKKVVRNQSSSAEFIADSKKVHGDTYDYSKVEYIKADSPVTIVCSLHGDFEQLPYNHKRGSGCPKCSSSHTKDYDEFMKRALEKHSDWYDYSRVSYDKMNDEIEIGCPNPDHGFFKTTASNHISPRSPYGCPKCVFRNNTQETFISLAKEIHGDYYGYEKVKYVKMKAPVTIICPRHGNFSVTPSNHCRKFQGCQNCSRGNLTQEEFIAKAQQVHGKGTYNYSAVKYVSQTKFVTIKCDKHSWTFKQQPVFHLRGKGCLICAHDKFAKLDERSTSWFIKESRKLHGRKYDYSKVDFSRVSHKVTIICPQHGEYQQYAYSHLAGCGCKKCSSSKGVKTVISILEEFGYEYEIEKTFEGLKYKKLLKYDFYLESLNLLIEYDGEQHFIPIELWGGDKKLKILQLRDSLKNKYAKDNGIELLRIRFDEDIREKLIPYL